MTGDPLKILNPKKFTKHKILDIIPDSLFVNEEYFKPGRIVWCKLDKESDLIKKTFGTKLYYVWVVTEDLKNITILSLDQAKLILSDPFAKRKVLLKPDAFTYNELLNKVRIESGKILNIKKSNNLMRQNKNQSSSEDGFASYTYDSDSVIKFRANRKVLFSLHKGDKFKVRRTDTDKNKILINGIDGRSFIISDFKAAFLIDRCI